jgi:hypothetical protein
MGVNSLSRDSILTEIKYNNFLAGNAAYDPSSDYLIQEQILTSTATTITFSSIPQDYKHLQLRSVSRTNAGTIDFNVILFNGDTAANYARHRLYASGTTVATGANASTAAPYGGISSISTDASGIFAASITDILDYSSSSKNKTVRNQAGTSGSAAVQLGLYSSVWLNVSAVTSLTITSSSASTFQIGSRFSLYGSKG